MQVTVLCECRMAPMAIDRDPNKFGAVIVKLGQDFVIERHLIAADGTPIGGIEGKNDDFVRKIVQRKHLVRGHVKVKSRSSRAGRKNLSHLLSPRDRNTDKRSFSARRVASR